MIWLPAWCQCGLGFNCQPVRLSIYLLVSFFIYNCCVRMTLMRVTGILTWGWVICVWDAYKGAFGCPSSPSQLLELSERPWCSRALSEVMTLTELLIECCDRRWSGKNRNGQSSPFPLMCVVLVCVDKIPWAGLKGLATKPTMVLRPHSVFLPPLENSELAGMHHSA